MAFNYVGSLNGSQKNLVGPILINGTDTVAVGEATEVYTNGKATNGVAAKPLKGVIHAITDADGVPQLTGSPVAGTAKTTAVTSITASGDDYVFIDTSPHSLYSATVSGTLGTTADSDLVGCRIDVDSANTEYGQVLETTATRTIGTPANFYSHGTDPKDATRLIVSLAMPEEMSVLE